MSLCKDIYNCKSWHPSILSLCFNTRGFLTITHPIQTAQNTIKGIVNRIKGFFHFSVPHPHIPLPHFSISPAGWNIGQLVKGKVPSLSVRWYRKAEEDPYLFKEKTLFGAGEHNDEILYGRTRLMNDIRDAVSGGSRQTILNFGDVNISGIDDIKGAAGEFMKYVKSEMEIA